jgi:hypothetical protein
MDTLLDTELGNEDIERCIQNTNNLGLPHDRAVASGEVRDHDAKEQVSGLLLRKGCRIPFAMVSRQYQLLAAKADMLTCCIAEQPSPPRRDPW